MASYTLIWRYGWCWMLDCECLGMRTTVVVSRLVRDEVLINCQLPIIPWRCKCGAGAAWWRPAHRHCLPGILDSAFSIICAYGYDQRLGGGFNALDMLQVWL